MHVKHLNDPLLFTKPWLAAAKVYASKGEYATIDLFILFPAHMCAAVGAARGQHSATRAAMLINKCRV